MTKEEWLQICRLNQEWYFRSVIDNPSNEWIIEHMPSDSVFDDGRIEFFEKNFKKEPIDKKKLDELAQKYIENIPVEDLEKAVTLDNPDGLMKLIYIAGYLKAKEE